MWIHMDEIPKGALRNFQSLIYSTAVLSTQFWIEKKSRIISYDQDFPERSTMFHNTPFWNALRSFIIFHWKILHNWRKSQIIIFHFRYFHL